MVRSIDSSHIALKTVPLNERIEYFIWKHDYYIVIQGVAVAFFKFLDVSTGFPSSIHDARILRLSKLEREIDQGPWLNGPSKRIGGLKLDLFW